MAAQQCKTRRPADEKPRSYEIAWVVLAKIVYGWTDARDRDIDRRWWNAALGARHLPLIEQAAAVKPSVFFDIASFPDLPETVPSVN